MKRRVIRFLAWTLICVVATTAFGLCGFPVRIDSGLVSTNTGSRREYTTWLHVLRSNERYTESPIETYLKKKNAKFEHRWVSYNGTGKDILGTPVLFAHGRPGAVLQMAPNLFEYIGRLPDTEKERIYQVLTNGSQEQIRSLVDKISEDFIDTKQ